MLPQPQVAGVRANVVDRQVERFLFVADRLGVTAEIVQAVHCGPGVVSGLEAPSQSGALPEAARRRAMSARRRAAQHSLR